MAFTIWRLLSAGQAHRLLNNFSNIQYAVRQMFTAAVLCLVLILPSLVWAENMLPPVLLSKEMQGIDLHPSLYWLPDPDKKLSIDDITQPDIAARFVPVPSGGDFSPYPAGLWLRFTVNNQSDEAIDWYLTDIINEVERYDVYQPTKDGAFVVNKGGMDAPRAEADLGYIKDIFKFTAPPHTSLTYYSQLAVHGGGGEAYWGAPTIWSEKPLFQHNQTELLLYGLAFGAMAVMGLYNLFIYFSLRDKSYLWYCGYVLVILVDLVTDAGFGQVYYMHGAKAHWIMIGGSTVLLLVTTAQFTRTFFNTRTTAPKIHRFLSWYLVFSIPSLLLYSSNLYASATAFINQWMLLSLMGMVNFLGIGFYYWRKGYRPARFYLLAWITWLGGVLLFGLTFSGVLPLSFAPLAREIILFGNVLDVTFFSLALADRIRLLREEKAIAEAATAVKDRFVALVSHDLRSPLVSMVQGMQLLRDSSTGTLSQQQQGLLGLMIESGERLLGTVTRLLDIQRLQTGKIELEQQWFRTRELVARQIEKLAAQAATKEISIVNELPDNFQLYGDPVLLGQVLQNLISNAIKFTACGGLITVFAPNGQNGVAVRDNGTGISPEKIPDLFRHEIRTTELGTAGEVGTGLGLPLCKDIMLAHGGDIRIESARGQGTTVFVLLPATPQSA